ncbi:hypothetical protein MRB53_007451 [Persea americana]|uniref:Uncharacterized protein n=1 Tax=Persea americana TaxID=3435 RepID=A0ACC2MK18_PERAE|nr:hypothetical protein MRB53_007451 [Persea americana]
MTTNSGESGSATKASNPKKANLMDPHSIKHLLDESVSDIVTSRGYTEDVRLSNIRLLLGIIIIAIALVAQFYPKKFPHNRDFLIGCILLKEKNAILFTYPLAGSFNSTGLVVSSKLPRFSDTYTLSVASADPKSVSAKKPVQLTKSVTQWFTRDGILVEGLFWKDVNKLIDDYTGDSRKNK